MLLMIIWKCEGHGNGLGMTGNIIYILRFLVRLPDVRNKASKKTLLNTCILLQKQMNNIYGIKSMQ